MKRSKLIVAASLAFSGLFLSCSCEDVHLGSLEQAGTLNQFLPAAAGTNVTVRYDNQEGKITYSEAYSGQTTTIPVKKTGKARTHGKGAVSSCVEYYTTTDRLVQANVKTTTFPLIISVVLTKNINPDGYTDIDDTKQLADVMHFTLGYGNKFPQTVTRGMLNYDGYKPIRTFTLAQDPARLINKKNSFTQEHLARVTLNGVTHENVYHLYLNSPQFTDEEQYLNSHYPLTYIQGIYVKAGIGLLQAYTATGQKFDFSL